SADLDFMDLVDEVLLEFLRSANVEDFVRDDWSFGELLTLLDEVALEHDDVLADRDELLLAHVGVRILDEDGELAANGRAEIDNAVDLRNFRGVFRTAGFEQFGY